MTDIILLAAAAVGIGFVGNLIYPKIKADFVMYREEPNPIPEIVSSNFKNSATGALALLVGRYLHTGQYICSPNMVWRLVVTRSGLLKHNLKDHAQSLVVSYPIANSPCFLCLDTNGNVIVYDRTGHRIVATQPVEQMITTADYIVLNRKCPSDGEKDVYCPYSITISNDGHVVVPRTIW